MRKEPQGRHRGDPVERKPIRLVQTVILDQIMELRIDGRVHPGTHRLQLSKLLLLRVEGKLGVSFEPRRRV